MSRSVGEDDSARVAPLPNPDAPVKTSPARRPIRLAVTVGDPRGIGPEILPTAIRRVIEGIPEVEMVALGDERSLSAVPKGIVRHDVGRFDGSLESAGSLSLRAIEEGVRMALGREIDALVTGPVHKPALRSVGVMHPGQTEL